jgi:hypothetical protein
MRRDAARAGCAPRNADSTVLAAAPARAARAEARVLERCPVPPVIETPVRTGRVQKGGATLLPRLPMMVLALALVAGATGRAAAEAPSLEICGNCIDDDGNGLVDLADAACCAPERTAAMKLRAGVIAPGAETSRLRLAATLGGDARISADGQQVLMQLGSAPNRSFCASMPPSAFRGTAEKLRLGRDAAAGARGVRRMSLRRRPDGGVRWQARGRRVGFSTDERQGSLDILLLLADATVPGEGARCFAARAFFRPGRNGTLVAQ